MRGFCFYSVMQLIRDRTCVPRLVLGGGKCALFFATVQFRQFIGDPLANPWANQDCRHEKSADDRDQHSPRPGIIS